MFAWLINCFHNLFKNNTHDLLQDVMEYYVNKLADFFNLNPLLWCLYPVLLILPVVVIATFCINPKRNQVQVDIQHYITCVLRQNISVCEIDSDRAYNV